MNWIDLLLILIVLLAVYAGWQVGFIFGLIGLVNWLGSVLLGFLFYPQTARLLEYLFPTIGVWLLPLAFILTILFARFLIGLITNQIATRTSIEANDNFLNHFLGIVPGFINGFIYATVIAALLLGLPLWDSVTSVVQQSGIANQLSSEVEWVDENLSPVFNKAIERTINNLTIHPASNETVKLSFRERNAIVRPDLESKMLELVNEERTNRGLNPLLPDPELTKVARSHARDMFERGYFAHINPEGKTPFDRMREANVQFLTAGENLALAHSLTIAHQGLMNSPGHRANILNPAFGRVGIGILDGGFYGLMVSQEFRN
jgi:uncharacterized protein YkwD